MPCFNGEKYIAEAIDSILGQSYDNFEFIIANDGSTDKTGEIINYYSSNHQVRTVENKKNLGISKTMNTLISLARGEYIARMDADDICFKDRIKKQVLFLDTFLEYDIVSSDTIFMNSQGKKFHKLHKPFWSIFGVANDRLDFGCVIVNSTVMFRSQKLKSIFPDGNFYRCEYDYCEDYDLFSRLKNKVKFYVLNEPLLYDRFHEDNISKKYNDRQCELTFAIIKRNINENLDICIKNKEIIKLVYVPWRDSQCTKDQFEKFISKNKKEIVTHNHLRQRVVFILFSQFFIRWNFIIGREALSIISVKDTIWAVLIFLKGCWRKIPILSVNIGIKNANKKSHLISYKQRDT